MISPAWLELLSRKSSRPAFICSAQTGRTTIATLSTDAGTRAERFYRADGWTETGKNTKGELMFEKRL
jgi:hypothetical protein